MLSHMEEMEQMMSDLMHEGPRGADSAPADAQSIAGTEAISDHEAAPDSSIADSDGLPQSMQPPKPSRSPISSTVGFTSPPMHARLGLEPSEFTQVLGSSRVLTSHHLLVLDAT